MIYFDRIISKRLSFEVDQKKLLMAPVLSWALHNHQSNGFYVKTRPYVHVLNTKYILIIIHISLNRIHPTVENRK